MGCHDELTLSVLSPSKDIASGRALFYTLLVGVERSTVDIGLELSSRIVFLEAPSISVDTLLREWVEGRCLLSDCVARELDELFAERRVIEIHGPLGSAIVGVDIDLALRH